VNKRQVFISFKYLDKDNVNNDDVEDDKEKQTLLKLLLQTERG
jgi:hypothetical protein